MANQTLPEEQPRYVIDEGVQHKEIKILSEEQARSLMKLYKAAGHVLTEDEKKLINQLQDKLDQETERVKSLRKLTITDKPLDEYLSKYKKGKGGNQRPETSEEEESGESSQPSTPTVSHIVGFKPEEVVRRYIECWNQQKFGAEYDCFSREFLRHDREAYINARHLSFQQYLGHGGMRIILNEILSHEASAGDAIVVARKTVQIGKRKSQDETDKYKLKLEKGHWVIYSVEPL